MRVIVVKYCIIDLWILVAAWLRSNLRFYFTFTFYFQLLFSSEVYERLVFSSLRVLETLKDTQFGDHLVSWIEVGTQFFCVVPTYVLASICRMTGESHGNNIAKNGRLRYNQNDSIFSRIQRLRPVFFFSLFFMSERNWDQRLLSYLCSNNINIKKILCKIIIFSHFSRWSY